MEVPRVEGSSCVLDHFAAFVARQLPNGFLPIRFVVTETENKLYHCEVGGISDNDWGGWPRLESIFRFVHRQVERTEHFNAVLIIPTGVGAEIGGHAGDAGPVSRLMAQVCDRLFLHPNVVNASDINEMPENALYVEGSVLCRLLMGTAGLQPVRANRVLVVIDAHKEKVFVDAAINAVSAARASSGLKCPEVVCLDPPVKLRSRFASSGRAAGRVEDLNELCHLLDTRKGEYDAVAVSSVIDVPSEFHLGYFDAHGGMVNPWGGVEAILTHALSSMYNIPTAHSPMFESKEIANLDPGIVDPRMAAEAVSTTFLNCILKGLHKSPSIITDAAAMKVPGILTAADVSCLVIPDGCLGLPTLAALQQGIPVIAVRENKNLMRNDLSLLPWAPGQFFQVENYWEAVGVMLSLKAGIDPRSVRRPLKPTCVVECRLEQRKRPSRRPKPASR